MFGNEKSVEKVQIISNKIYRINRYEQYFCGWISFHNDEFTGVSYGINMDYIPLAQNMTNLALLSMAKSARSDYPQKIKKGIETII